MGAKKLVFLSDLTQKHQKRLARPAKYKHSSLFELLISNKEKILITLSPLLDAIVTFCSIQHGRISWIG
jgi:hypothetical protein